MKRSAIEKASEHMDIAVEAVDRMTAATSFADYERAWRDFLAQAGRIYMKLEQGAKGCGKSNHWFGGRKGERKEDPLLAYIHHARNSEEHTIENTTSLVAEGLIARAKTSGAFKVSCQFMVDSQGKQHYRNVVATGPEGQPMPYEFVNPEPTLLPVLDRSIRYDPPRMHLGRPLVDITPRGVADMALTYLRTLVTEAGQLPLRF